MSFVLTTISQVTCGHGGHVKVEGDAKLQVNGNPVLVQNSIEGKNIPDCPTPPSDQSDPCTTVSSIPPPAITEGWARKLFVGGQPVMLDTLAGKTNGKVNGVTPQSLLKGVAGQTKLTAV